MVLRNNLAALGGESFGFNLVPRLAKLQNPRSEAKTATAPKCINGCQWPGFQGLQNPFGLRHGSVLDGVCVVVAVAARVLGVIPVAVLAPAAWNFKPGFRDFGLELVALHDWDVGHAALAAMLRSATAMTPG